MCRGIGYAIIAGVNPIYGLYTGFLPPIVAAFTTGSVFMQVIATNELSIPIGRIAAGTAGGFTVDKLFTLTLLVGVFALVAGLLRLGRAMRFISNSVMTGFVLGLMLLLIVGQAANLAGYRAPLSGSDLSRLGEILADSGGVDTMVLAVGIASIVVTALLLRTPLHRFAYLITLVGASALVTAFVPARIPLAGGGAHIEAGFPWPVLPDLHAIPELILPAFTLTIVGLSFGAGVAQQFPSRDGHIGDPSRDFLGQGIANVVSAFFQCMPSGGSMSRTAYLVEAGAQTRWANVFTGLGMLAIVLTAADLAGQYSAHCCRRPAHGAWLHRARPRARPARVARQSRGAVDDDRHRRADAGDVAAVGDSRRRLSQHGELRAGVRHDGRADAPRARRGWPVRGSGAAEALSVR